MPAYLKAKAAVAEAQRQLDHATVRAPMDGIVTGVSAAQPGLYLAASNAAFGLVSTDHVWVEANPKETELTYVKPGDPVDVTVDTYPGRTWHGTVDSIAPASGSEFSILPAQNSSGNWVKVVQRITVRIQPRPQARRPAAPRRHERRSRHRHRPHPVAARPVLDPAMAEPEQGPQPRC